MFIYSFISDRRHEYFIRNRNGTMIFFFLIVLHLHAKFKTEHEFDSYFKTTNKIFEIYFCCTEEI